MKKQETIEKLRILFSNEKFLINKNKERTKKLKEINSKTNYEEFYKTTYRKCHKCKQNKLLINFESNIGLKYGKGYTCLDCGHEKSRNYNKTHKEVSKRWAKNNKKYYRNYRKNKYYTDIVWNLKEKIRWAIQKKFKKQKVDKNGKTFKLLKYTPKELKEHLYVYLNKPCILCNKIILTIHNSDIDHIIPISLAITKEEILQLNQRANLRLICSKCNNIKGVLDREMVQKMKEIENDNNC